MIRAIWGFTKLFFQTFQVIGQAVFQILADKKRTEYGDVDRYPQRISKNDLEVRRMRREQELIQKFKTKS